MPEATPAAKTEVVTPAKTEVVAAPVVDPKVAPAADPKTPEQMNLLGGESDPVKTDPAKTEVDKVADPKTTDKPVELELKFPDGFQKDEAMVSDFKSVAKELSLKPEQAQKLADVYVKAQTSAVQKLESEGKAIIDGWKKSVVEDKEIGGESYKDNLKLANDGYKKFASKDLQKFLGDQGLVNHPEVIRHFYRLAKQDAEPGALPRGTGAPVKTEEARLRAQYPNSPELFTAR